MKGIPADGIYYDDALLIVAEMITPNWQKIVEERLNPAPPHDDAFPERNDKARAKDEVERAYYNALDLAHERLTEKRSQGILVALVRNPITGQVDQLHRDANIDRYAPERNGQPIYFDHETFDAVTGIDRPTTRANTTGIMKAFKPRQARPAERELLKPKAWLAEIRKDHPQQRNEQLVSYAGRLYDLMQEAHVTKVWALKTLLRRLHDK